VSQKIKLIELTDQPWIARWRPLGSILKSELELEFESAIIDTTPGSLEKELRTALESDADLCRVSDSFCREVLKYLPNTTHAATFAGAAPFIIREEGVWWPRSVLDDALSRSISSYLGQVDIASSALIAGAGEITRLVVAAVVKAGFATVNVTDKNQSLLNTLVEEMKRKYFQVQFHGVPFDAITMLPGIHSLVINTTPLSVENDLLEELYFFNFLKAGGAVVDLTLVPAQTPLMMEAEQWGARHMSGDFIASERDALMIERLVKKSLPVEKYRQALRAEIDAVPFDPGPFLERFRRRGTQN